jgi:hypothetical protein
VPSRAKMSSTRGSAAWARLRRRAPGDARPTVSEGGGHPVSVTFRMRSREGACEGAVSPLGLPESRHSRETHVLQNLQTWWAG